MSVVEALIHKRDPFDVKRINALRVEFLELSPIRDVSPENGLGKVMMHLLSSVS